MSHVKKYDLIFGLGAACSCTQTLRKAGLQLLSFPCDWCGPEDRYATGEPVLHDLCIRAKQLCTSFAGCFDPEDFKSCGVDPRNRFLVYRNVKTGCLFNHDIPNGSDFSAAFAEMTAKYRRRTARILKILSTAKDVLIVRLDRPDQLTPTPLDDCRQARAILSERFPGVRFDLILFSFEKGRRFEDRLDEAIENGLRRVTFDYKDPDPDSPPFQPALALTAAVLRESYQVAEYRTREEIAAGNRRERLKRYAKFGATTYLGYRLARIKCALLGRT